MAKPVTTSAHAKKWRIRDEAIYDGIMALVQENTEKAVRPEDIAMHVFKDDWQSLLKRIRMFARKLAHEGYVEIVRKNEVADPDDFRGVYRVRASAKAAEYVTRMPAAKKAPAEK